MTGITLQVLPGDGIGPEIMKSTVDVVTEATRREGVATAFEHDRIGWEAYEAEGTTCPDRVLARAREVAGTLLGPISHLDYPARDKGGVNVSAAFRVKLDLYANIRPARTRPGLGRVRQDFDVVIVRECTEGFYPDRNMAVGSGEFMPTPDVALSVRKITSFACERIARRAFEIASVRRRKVVAVHKANNFILTDGLFLAKTREVAKDFPDVELEEIIIDAMAAHLVRDASRYDVILATNFYADILSDLASELSGGLGLAGSINANETLCAAQAQHGSAPDIAGRDVANPTSMILSAAMLFDWLGETRQDAQLAAVGKRIHAAVEKTLAEPATRTRDLGGTLGTHDFGKVVVAALA